MRINSSTTKTEIFQELRNQGVLEPVSYLAYPNQDVDWTTFCDYHQNFTHNTEECRALKHKLEKLVKDGKLEFILKDEMEKDDVKNCVLTKDDVFAIIPKYNGSGDLLSIVLSLKKL